MESIFRSPEALSAAIDDVAKIFGFVSPVLPIVEKRQPVVYLPFTDVRYDCIHFKNTPIHTYAVIQLESYLEAGGVKLQLVKMSEQDARDFLPAERYFACLDMRSSTPQQIFQYTNAIMRDHLRKLGADL